MSAENQNPVCEIWLGLRTRKPRICGDMVMVRLFDRMTKTWTGVCQRHGLSLLTEARRMKLGQWSAQQGEGEGK